MVKLWSSFVNFFYDIYVVLVTLPRDLTGIYRFIKIRLNLRWGKLKGHTVGYVFQQTARKYPNKVCFYFQDKQWTFKQINELSNQIGNYFASIGYKKGDCIALFMENRPEYVCMWLGLSKIGVITALINYNLRQKSLKHSLKVADAKALIFGTESFQPIGDILKDEETTAVATDDIRITNLPLYSFGDDVTNITFQFTNLNSKLASSSTAVPDTKEPLGFLDKLCYIYTSGTTGLPKAAIVKHSRVFMTSYGAHYMNALTPRDILYTPLPLYHMQGGVVGVGQALFFGSSVVIIKKFSASGFWKDCHHYNVNVCQYMGELCRYLLNQPPSELEKKHRVTKMFGNGLRPEIWDQFVSRFSNPKMHSIKMLELYGSSEGNVSLVNHEGRHGAVGFMPLLIYPLVPMGLIKVDDVTGQVIRNKAGLAIRSPRNEPGELVGIIMKDDPTRDFVGYTDSSATNAKILENVFKKGDMAFRTGDILVRDTFNYFRFKDRSGDTFKWKGENVSTEEVGAAISSLVGLKDVVVFGVSVPGAEGKAGMAVIADPDSSLDLSHLAEGLGKELPPYARPLFLRVKESINTTGTFKLQKFGLQNEGFDPRTIPDKMYFLQNAVYEPLDADLYERIMNSTIRL